MNWLLTDMRKSNAVKKAIIDLLRHEQKVKILKSKEKAAAAHTREQQASPVADGGEAEEAKPKKQRRSSAAAVSREPEKMNLILSLGRT